jgi:hypothetical protein
LAIQINTDEELHDNPDVDPRGYDLHDYVCSREGQLQKDRQELSDERQERVQLRQRLRLR